MLLTVLLFIQQSSHGEESPPFVHQPVQVEGTIKWVKLLHLGPENQPVLTVSFLASQVEPRLAMLPLDRGENRFQAPGLERTLSVGKKTVLVASGDVDPSPGKELILVSSKEVEKIAFASGILPSEPKVLLERELESFFQDTSAQGPLFWPHVSDLNRDGLDDLLLPGIAGYSLLFQNPAGAFSHAEFFPLQEETSLEVRKNQFLSGEIRLPSAIVEDFNGDGMPDLHFYDGGEFCCFIQKKEGGFSSTPSIRKKIPALSEIRPLKDEDTFYQLLVFLKDIDGDSRMDMLVSRSSGEMEIFETSKTQFLFFPGGMGFFSEKPGQIINIKGINVNPLLMDYDGDKTLDLLVPSFRTDLLTSLKQTLLQSIKITFYLFLFQSQQQRFSSRPDLSKTVDLPLDALEEGRTLPLVYFDGDFDGDGRLDLLSLIPEEGMRIYRGIRRGGFLRKSDFDFESKPFFQFSFPVSNALEMGDFNQDGRCDLAFFRNGELHLFLSQEVQK